MAEVGGASGWWRRLGHLGRTYELDQVRMIILMGMPTMDTWELLYPGSDIGCLEEAAVERIRKTGRREWGSSFADTEEAAEYLKWKGAGPRMESYADSSEGARVRMMWRGGRLPVRANRCVRWRNMSTLCQCGEKETARHLFLGCVLVRVEREQLVQALGARTLEEAGGERLLLGYSGSERDQQTAKRA